MASIKSKLKGVKSLVNAAKPWLRWIKNTANTAVKNVKDTYSTAKNYVNAVAKWTSNPAWYAKAKTSADNYNKRADAFNKWVDAYNERWAQPWQWTPMSHLNFREVPKSVTINWKTQRYPLLEKPVQNSSDILNKRLNDINEVKRRAQPWLDQLDKEFNEATKLFSTQDTPYIPQDTPAYKINNSIIRNWFDESYQLPQRYSNAIQIDDIDQIMKDFNLTREQALDYAADNYVKQHRWNTNIDYVNKHNKLNDSIRNKEREWIELDYSRDADLENASIEWDRLNEWYDYPRYNTDANINSIKKSYADAENRISREYKSLTDEMKNFEKNHSPYTVSNYRKLKEVNTRPFRPFAF